MSVEKRLRGLTRKIPVVGHRLAHQSLLTLLAAYVSYQVITTGAIYLGFRLSSLRDSSLAAEKRGSESSETQDPKFTGTGMMTLSNGEAITVAYSCSGPLTADNVLSLGCTLTPSSPFELGRHFELEARITGERQTLIRPNCSAGNPYILPIEDAQTAAEQRETCRLAELVLSGYTASMQNGHR